jgi:UDP-N-acetylmuramoyl-L-alanyl-D-glutamate--2,6-diaminopimelate ligase
MKLSELVMGLACAPCADTDIDKVCYDSRQVQPGDLYVALIGARLDGHDFIKSACDRGAAAVIHSRHVEIPEGVIGIRVDDSRAALSKVACRFYKFPSSRLKVVGITGTKGKTTTAYLVRHILAANGMKPGMLGSLEYNTGLRKINALNTTPESLDVAEYMAEMLVAGCDSCVMEVSSHALAQGRVEDVSFDVGVLTNMGHDHLDYHLTYEGYLMAKAKLFAKLGERLDEGSKPWIGTAVINADDQYADYMGRKARDAGARSITYGLGKSAYLLADDIIKGPSGTGFSVRTLDGDEVCVSTGLVGTFNVYNCLAAMGTCMALGINLEASAASLLSFEGIPGRFEKVGKGQEFSVIVDFAHNPESLESALNTAREFTNGKLIVVFGCCGNRDRSNRPWMARISQRLADRVFVTHDNPLDEKPESIIEDIKAGLTEGTPYEIEPDRAVAIRKAIALAQKGDTVLIAGKGAETYQRTGQRVVHFDDREEAMAAIKERGGK